MASGAAPTIGIILAGGRARRFGGIDKALLTLAGKPLIRHVIDRIAPQVSALIINANHASAEVQALGLPLCADHPRLTPATGPLVGLTSVLAELEQRKDIASSLLTVPVDTPFLPRDLVARVGAALAETGAPVAYAATQLRDHPIVALWNAASRDPVRALFARQPTISLHALMERLGAVRVVFDDAPVDPFLNINTARDLAAAERILALRTPERCAFFPLPDRAG